MPLSVARQVLCGGAWLGCVLCIVLAFQALSRGDEDLDYADSQLPAAAYLAYSRIGRQYGTFAAAHWRYAIYERNPTLAATMFGPVSNQPIVQEQIQRAVAAGFSVRPDEHQDEDIMRTYAQLRAAAPNLRRRAAFCERFKDMMAYIGGAAVFGLLGFALMPRRRVAANAIRDA